MHDRYVNYSGRVSPPAGARATGSDPIAEKTAQWSLTPLPAVASFQPMNQPPVYLDHAATTPGSP